MSKWRRLKYVADTATSNVDKLKDPNETPIRLVNYTDVYYGDRLTPDLPLMEATASTAEIAKFRVSSGDVIITKDSETADDIGIAAYVESASDDMVCGYHLALIRAQHSTSDSRYLYWALTGDHAREQMSMTATGVTRFGLRAESIQNLLIRLPPLPEQRAIADYLDTETARIDTLISKKRRLIELLQERWREIRRVRVLSGLDPVNGGGLLEPWNEVNLGVLIELQRGHDLPSDNRIDGDIPVVSSGGVSGSHNVATAKGPGVVTGRYGTVGEVFFVDGPYWPLNTTLYVKDFRGNHPQWVYHLLASIPLNSDSQKSAVGGINRNIVGSLRVPRPPATVQRAIARDLDKAEGLSNETRRKLDTQIHLLQERRRTLITAAVTGEIPVPGVPD